MKKEKIQICPNCNSKVTGQYCSECGQKQGELIPTFNQWFTDTLFGIISFDSKLFKSIKALVKKPGHLTSEWVIGKRESYTSPLKLYLFTSIIVFFLSQFSEIGFIKGTVEGFLEKSNNLGSIQNETQQIVGSVQFFISKFEKVILFVLMPIFAFLIGLFFKNKNDKYAKHFVFTLHFYSYSNLLMLIPIFISIFDNDFGTIIILLFFFIYFTIYLILSVIHVYLARWYYAIPKVLLILLIYYFINFISMALILILGEQTGQII